MGHLKVAMIGMVKAENLEQAMVALVGERLTTLAKQVVEAETEEPHRAAVAEVGIQSQALVAQAVQAAEER